MSALRTQVVTVTAVVGPARSVDARDATAFVFRHLQAPRSTIAVLLGGHLVTVVSESRHPGERDDDGQRRRQQYSCESYDSSDDWAHLGCRLVAQIIQPHVAWNLGQLGLENPSEDRAGFGQRLSIGLHGELVPLGLRPVARFVGGLGRSTARASNLSLRLTGWPD